MQLKTQSRKYHQNHRAKEEEDEGVDDQERERDREEKVGGLRDW